jgi:hypothetical protein
MMGRISLPSLPTIEYKKPKLIAIALAQGDMAHSTQQSKVVKKRTYKPVKKRPRSVWPRRERIAVIDMKVAAPK